MLFVEHLKKKNVRLLFENAQHSLRENKEPVSSSLLQNIDERYRNLYSIRHQHICYIHLACLLHIWIPYYID